jgi:phage FluMu protein Com
MSAIEVSCPDCQGLNIIEMKHREPTGGFVDLLTKMVGDMGINNYAFTGEKKCSKCGKNIDVSINVSNSRTVNPGIQLARNFG